MYTEISVEGPPHERRFTCAAIIDGEELGRGEGPTKKAAEQEAAREALAKLDAASSRISGILCRLMAERRPTNSELRLRRLTEEEPDSEPRGIFEIFAEDEQADEDAPLARDDERDRGSSVLPPL